MDNQQSQSQMDNQQPPMDNQQSHRWIINNHIDG